MRLIVQRSLESSVSISNNIVGKINKGVVVFVAFTHTDTEDDIKYLVHKLTKLRIFDDENGIMNLSLLDVEGEILSISQFTLYADATNGNRPSYTNSMKGNEAIHLYDRWNELLKETGLKVETGVFGADMLVSITNDGPVTIILESRK